MKTFTKHILLLALMLFGVAGAAWAQTHQKYTGPVDIATLVQGDTLAPGFELTGISASDNLHFDGGRFSFNGTPQADPIGAAIGTANSLSYTDGNIILIYGQATFTLAPMVDMTTAGNAWVVTDVYSNTNGSEIHISGISIDLAPDPTVPALDELTGNWNFLMPGANKVVKAVLLDSIVLGPHVSVAVQPVQDFISYTRPGIGGDSTVLYYDPTLANSSFGFIANDDDGQGRNFAFWADDQNNHNTDRDFGGFSELTCGQRFVAVYPDNHTLTLATPQGGGTLEIAGVTYDTVYNINFYHIGSPEGTRSFTIPASRLPYDTTFSYGSANVMYAEVDEQSGKLRKIQVEQSVTIRIEGAFEGPAHYTCMLDGDGDPDEWVITCMAGGTQPKMPYGIRKTGNGTYSVMEGLTVNVTATPDSAHYLSAIDGHDTVSNAACGYSFVMPSGNKDLLATFTAKPTLTLAQTDGGTLEAIVPQGGVTAMHLTTDQIPTWDGNTEYAMAADLQQFGFVAVDSAAAAAWTGAPASGYITLVYALAGNQFKTIVFQDGQWFAATTFDFYKADFYTSPDVFYFTTGVSKSNVIASTTEPNTYYIDYGTPVTVVATPDAQHYLVSFSDDAPATERNSNLAVEKTYDSVIAPINLSANFQAKPTLTLTANEGGTLTLDGMTEPSATGTTFTVPGTWQDDNTPLTATDFPGFVPVSQEEALTWQAPASGNYRLLYKYEGGHWYYININNGTLGITGYEDLHRFNTYSIQNNGRTIVYTTGAIGGMPAGVVSANATLDTFVVDYNTDVTVKATPDSIHYLATLGEELVNSNDSIHRTFTMTAPVNLPADFRAKPTLTLAHNDGGEMEAIVPQGGVTAIVPPTDQISGWENDNAGYLTESDMPAELGFVAVDQAAAEAWTGAPATGDAMLIYDIDGETFYYMSFHDGSLTGNSIVFFSPGTFYQMASAGTLYITTGTHSNVTASTEPNTYYIDYNTSVTVKATPSDTAYLVRFDQDDDTNSNTAVEKTYGPLTAALTTATATFNDKPVLTLAANDTSWGKVMLEGAGSGSSNGYTIKFSANGNTIVKENVTLPKTYQCEYGSPSEFDNIIRELYGWTGAHGNENAIPTVTGTDAITPGTVPSDNNYPKFTINSAFQGTATVTIGYTNSSWVSDNWPIEISFVPALPAGVAQLDSVTYRVDYGTEVTVQAIPDTAHYLVRFDNDADTNSNVAVEKTYQNITADVTSEALFAPKPKLTLAKTRTMDDTDDWGSVSFNPLQYPWLGTSQNTGPLFLTDEPDVYVVDYGATVTVTADATELHHVANWVDADSAAYPADRITYSAYFVTEPVALFPDSSTLTLTVTADTTAKAVFGINSYDVFATAQLDDRDEIGTGTAMGYLNVSYKDIVGTTQTAGPEDTLDYTAQGGSLSTITSTSYYGYRFSGWYDADMDTLMSSVNPLTLTEAAVVEARYTPINYTITGLSEDDEMGTVTGGGTLPYRTPVSLTAVPERGYHFTGWDNGLSANPLELAAMSDFTVTASFAPNQYTVTVLSGDETMGSASGSTVADFHTTVTLTATPNAHYHFVAWSNGVTDTVTELLVDGDTTVTALFAADEYTITGLSADSTMGSVSGSATVTYPATVTLTATAANCHHFVQWNDGVTANPRTVNALEDLTLTATFAASTYASSEDVTTCDNYTWNNVTYTASGTYTYNTTTLAGCDSTATLHLTLITGIETEEVVEACESYEWHGVVYTQSTGILGAPTYTTTALNGCDSTVTLRLTINHGTTAVETVEACDSYTWNGHTYFSSTTTATYTTEGSNGCDSTTTLHLTLGRSTSGELNVEACESYTWHGVTYTESIVGPTDTNLNTSGCPHVTTLHLTILRNSSSEETVEACDVYNWHGVNRYASGDYVFLSPNAVGCDSTAILHLTIRRSTHAEEIAAACDEYEWHGILFTESADTTLHTLNAAGCDSAMTLHLTLYYNSEATDVVTACDSYTWIDGVTYTASTDEPTYTIAGANCSTTVTLNLTVNYSTAGIDEQEAVDSYTWINGITYTASTDQPTFVLTNAAGCDSVVTLHLTITYTPEPVYYNVTLATADATMGSVAPAGTTVIEEGLSFTATATALTGRHFVAWVSNGTVVSNANPYTFVVNDDVELTATFDYDEVIAVLTVNDETMGTTTPAPGTYTFHVGDEATVTATANEHYHFVGWTVNGTPINTQETTYTVTVTPEMAGMTFYVEAVFAQNEGIDDNEGTLEATVYAQEGQIVVEGAGNSTVVLYDVTGRRLAIKHSDNAPLRFDIAVSGTYLVKVGNAPAKRIVMVR